MRIRMFLKKNVPYVFIFHLEFRPLEQVVHDCFFLPSEQPGEVGTTCVQRWARKDYFQFIRSWTTHCVRFYARKGAEFFLWKYVAVFNH